MKANVEVKDRREADAIRTALDDPMMRAMVVITGLLTPLTPRARKRVLDFVIDNLEEHSTKTVVTEGNSGG